MLTTSSVPDASSSHRDIPLIGKQEAISKIKSLRKDQVLVVDFDQTFFMRNSSKEFIRMVKPYIFGALLYKFLELLRPWTWFASKEKSELTRDWFHVWAITIVFPWTWLLWRLHAAKMAVAWTNQELVKVLRDRDPELLVLSTQGFGPIVRPILKHMGVQFGKVSACRLFGGYADRLRSKVKSVGTLIGNPALQKSAVITDSEDDRDLLDFVEVPLLLEWPKSPVLSVTSHYIPFYYLCKIKLKGLSRILREVLYVDLLLLLLTFTWISPIPLLHAVGITFFYMSFLLIYEIGYMENDDVAYKLEKDPVLGEAFEEKRDYLNYIAPWLWAIPFTFAGSAIVSQIDYLSQLGVTSASFLSHPHLVVGSVLDGLFAQSQLKLFGIWLGLLVSMRYVYMFYNYTDKMTRTWVYPFLQFYKSMAFMLVSPINIIGAVALFCQMSARSFAYFLYRWGRKDWPGSELYLVRFLLFIGILFMLGFVLKTGFAEFLTLQSLAILLWMSSRTIKPIFMVFQNMKHISKDDWTKSEE